MADDLKESRLSRLLPKVICPSPSPCTHLPSLVPPLTPFRQLRRQGLGEKRSTPCMQDHHLRGRVATRKSEISPSYCCLPACVSCVEFDFLRRNVLIFGFQKVFKCTEKQQGYLAKEKRTKGKTNTSSADNRTAQPISTTPQGSTAPQDTAQGAGHHRTTHRTARHHDTPERHHHTAERPGRHHNKQGHATDEAPTTAQTQLEPNNTTRSATQHRTHRVKTQTNTTSKGKRTAGRHSTAPADNHGPPNPAPHHSTPKETAQHMAAHHSTGRQQQHAPDEQHYASAPAQRSTAPHRAERTGNTRHSTQGHTKHKAERRTTAHTTTQRQNTHSAGEHRKTERRKAQGPRATGSTRGHGTTSSGTNRGQHNNTAHNSTHTTQHPNQERRGAADTRAQTHTPTARTPARNGGVQAERPHQHTPSPTPQPGVAGRSRSRSPNTHTHTAHPCQEWLGASGART